MLMMPHEPVGASNGPSPFQQTTTRIVLTLLAFGTAMLLSCAGARLLLDHWR